MNNNKLKCILYPLRLRLGGIILVKIDKWLSYFAQLDKKISN